MRSSKHHIPGKHAGITLIELMVVVAIMVILTAIAYPLYTNQVIKARRTDGRAAVQAIALAQERYYTVNGSYTGTLSQLDLNSNLTDGDSEEGYYNIAVNVSGATFLISATPAAGGPQVNDSECTSMTLNQLGITNGTGSDATKCW